MPGQNVPGQRVPAKIHYDVSERFSFLTSIAASRAICAPARNALRNQHASNGRRVPTPTRGLSRRSGAHFTGAVVCRPIGIVTRLFGLWRSPAMELASVVHSAVVRSGRAAVSAARSLEIAGQLRAAVLEGDDARIA